MIDYDVLDHPPAHLGEGPIWDHRARRFVWVDAYSDGFYSLEWDGRGSSAATPHHWHTAAFTIGLALADIGLDAGDPSNRLGIEVGDASPGTSVVSPWYLVVSADDIAPYSVDIILTRTGRSLPSYDATVMQSGVYRYNDVSAVPGGYFLAGIMPRQPGAPRHRPDTGCLVGYGSVAPSEGVGTEGVVPRVVVTDVRLSNGIGWSPDERWMYYTDTLRNGIFRYSTEMIIEIIDGSRPPISLADAHRPFIAVTDLKGSPDGLTVAADGTIFSARWGGGAVDRYDTEGKRIETFEVPARQPTSIAFGGEDLTTMIITSATEGLPASKRTPHDGCTFVTSIGVKGRREPVVRYK